MKQYTILTKNGLNKLISASANQTTITLKEMAVGDGSGEINQDATALQSERHRFAINAITINQNDSNILEVEGVLQADIGGFYVREAGIFCDDGSLFAIAKVAESYKPLLAEGSAKDITISFQIQISNTSLINLKVDNNVVLATRKWVLANYLPIKGKAADSDKFDGLDSSAFVQLAGVLNTFTGENKFTKNTYFGRAFINAPTPELNLNIVHAENGKSIVLSVKTAEGQLENFWLNPTSLSLANKNLDVGKGLIYNSKPQTSANFTDSSLVAFKNSDNAIQYTTVEKLISILKNSLADITTLFGVGQTWQDVKNQRQPNIVYTNATKRPIMVAVTYTVASGSYGLQIEVDGKVVTNGVNASPVIVPAGSTYKAVPVSAATIVTWTELR